jgi:hypothetical protein
MISMIDANAKRTRDGRLNYIFPHCWSWIECLLGEIRTMLQGMAYYHKAEGHKTPTGESLGGGNIAVPILVTTALEFVSRLYCGTTGTRKQEGYDAAHNVECFLTSGLFEGAASQAPRLIWNAVRNGLHHNFWANTHSYDSNGHHYRFFFRFASIEVPQAPCVAAMLDGDEVQIIIAAADLAASIERAIEKYGTQLLRDDKLQENFIKAWDWLEGYTAAPQPPEAEALLKLLPAEGDAVGLFTPTTYKCERDVDNPACTRYGPSGGGIWYVVSS